jgi:hypothetical protein
MLAVGLLGLAFVAFAAPRFPPAGDGTFYDVVARRIALGQGYTWLWPDGVVTYAAHYPVGYPAWLGGLYRVFGPHPGLAMLLNLAALLALVWATERLVGRVASARRARLAACVVGLHPTLFLYLPLMMTELLCAALLLVSAALAFERPGTVWGRGVVLFALGALFGLMTLIRPQLLLFAPAFGAWFGFGSPASSTSEGARPKWSRRAVSGGLTAAAVTLIAVGLCLPWTLRNCDKMKSCVFVSANGGWNLLIGTSERGRGGFISIDEMGVPEQCRLVFDEVGKDRCFGAAARERILAEPLRFARLVPDKLSRLFDDVGAPGWYLHASNPSLITPRVKTVLGGVEVVVHRSLALLALFAAATADGPRRRLRLLLAVVAAGFLLTTAGWVGLLLFIPLALLLGRSLLDHPTLLLLALGIAVTAVVHAVFFGGARYAVVVLPWVVCAAMTARRPLWLAWPRSRPGF